MTFDEWRATRKWFDRLEDHAAGSSETGGWGYSPGWIARNGETFWTLSDRSDYSSESLEDAEAWLWMNYAHMEH